MPSPIFSRLMKPATKVYLLNDTFGDAQAAGWLNGVSQKANPGPGVRTGVDTEAKMSIAGGVLSFAGGKAAPAQGDPGLWYPAVTRLAGRILLVNFMRTGGTYSQIGWDTGQSGAVVGFAYEFYPASVLMRIQAGVPVAIGTYTTGETIKLVFICRAVGGFYLAKSGTGNCLLLFFDSNGSDATLYPGLSNYDAVFTADNILIPATLWLPAPLASDSFTRADGALGSTDGLGHAEQNGGAGLAWVFDSGVWTIATNKAVGTPTQGTPIMGGDTLNGNMETGDPPGTWTASNATLDGVADERTGGAGIQSLSVARNGANSAYGLQTLTSVVGIWYLVTGWVRNVDADNCKLTLGGVYSAAITGTTWTQCIVCKRAQDITLIISGYTYSVGADGTSARFDDMAVVPLTLSSLFATVPCGTPNVKVRAKVSALTTGTQAGICARVDNTTTPANFVIAYFSGDGNVKLDECVAGTYTNKLSGAKAFTAADTLEMELNGSAYRVYHITSAGVATLIGSGTLTSVTTGNNHGTFSTYSGNTFGGCEIWAVGAEGQYESLGSLI